MSFADFIDPVELQTLCGKIYDSRFSAWSDSRNVFLNRDDMIQTALIRCWRMHGRWRADGGASKRTWLSAQIKWAFLDQLKIHTRRRDRIGPAVKFVDVDMFDPSEDRRIPQPTGETTKFRGQQIKDRVTKMAKMRRNGATLNAIAREFGCTFSHVSSLLTARARLRLKA